MKIAQVICIFPPHFGGMGNSVYYFTQALVAQGHEVTVFTPSYGKKNNLVTPNNEQAKFKIKRLRPLFSYGNAAILPQLFWKLDGFDIIHLHYPFYGSAEIILLKKIFSGKKMKLAIHYHMDNKAPGVKGFIFNLYRLFFLPLLVRAAKIITCASLDYVKHSNLAKYYKTYPQKFKQVLFGVDLDQFNTYNKQPTSREKNKIILFVGALDNAHYFKGLTNLFYAFKKIRKIDQFKKTKLAIVGEGNRKNYYKNYAKKLKIDEAVIFYDRVDNKKLVDIYNEANVVVLPSINQGEAFGLVLLEAMACSKPVIASNLPGVRSVFKNGNQGLLVKPGDVKDLVKKIKIILTDDQLAERMGRAGRSLVINKYTWDKVGKRLNVIYHYVKYTPS